MTFNKEELEILKYTINELISRDDWDYYSETNATFLLLDKIRKELKHLDDI